MANWSWLAPITSTDGHGCSGNIVFKVARASNQQEPGGGGSRDRNKLIFDAPEANRGGPLNSPVSRGRG